MKRLTFAAVLFAILSVSACERGGIGEPCNRDGTCDNDNLVCHPWERPGDFRFQCVFRGGGRQPQGLARSRVLSAVSRKFFDQIWWDSNLQNSLTSNVIVYNVIG